MISQTLLGHHFYDPKIGRFITKDPAGSGDNWYAYCENNPLTKVDPQGTSPADAARLVRANRARILRISQEFGIQPELIAGVIWTEHGSGVDGASRANEIASMVLYEWGFDASFGIMNVRQSATAWKQPGGHFVSHLDYMTQYLSTPDNSLREGANMLRWIAGRPNRYPGREGQLTRQEMAIVLTEYNGKRKNTPANRARPSAHGRAFLRSFDRMRDVLYGRE